MIDTLHYLESNPELVVRRISSFLNAFEAFPIELAISITPAMNLLFSETQRELGTTSLNKLENERIFIQKKSALLSYCIENHLNLFHIVNPSLLLPLQNTLSSFNIHDDASILVAWEILESTLEALSKIIDADYLSTHSKSIECIRMYEHVFSIWNRLNKTIRNKDIHYRKAKENLEIFSKHLRSKGIKISRKTQYSPIEV